MSKVFTFLPDSGAGGGVGSSDEIGRYVTTLPSSEIGTNTNYVEIGEKANTQDYLIEIVDAPDLAALNELQIPKTATNLTSIGNVTEAITTSGNVYSNNLIDCNGRHFLLTTDQTNDDLYLYYTDNINLTGWTLVKGPFNLGHTSQSWTASGMVFNGDKTMMLFSKGGYQLFDTVNLVDLTGELVTPAGSAITTPDTIHFNPALKKWIIISFSSNIIKIYESESGVLFNQTSQLSISGSGSDISNPINFSYVSGYYYLAHRSDIGKIIKIKEGEWTGEIVNDTVTITLNQPWVLSNPSVTETGTIVQYIARNSTTYNQMEVIVSKNDGDTWTQKVLTTTQTSPSFSNYPYKIVPVEGDTFLIYFLGLSVGVTYDAFDSMSMLIDIPTGSDGGLQRGGGMVYNNRNNFAVVGLTNTGTPNIKKFSFDKDEILKLPRTTEQSSAIYMKIK